MFDPTAFENMRVVLEGIFYDKDLLGDISIKDRNDCINTAKLSRTYELTFQLLSQKPLVTCKVILQANLENLAAELLPTHSNRSSGCALLIEYYFSYLYNHSLLFKLNHIIEEIWGMNRKIQIFVLSEPLKDNQVTYIIKLSFDRLIREDQMDDFAEMTQYILTTLEKLSCVTEM